ncbi:crossover junction endodeoxyribonuclease RusA [Glaciihabitans sp. UYNi722]
MYQYFVPGDPAPKGSKRFVGLTRTGRGILIESSKRVAPWTAAVMVATESAVDFPARFDAIDTAVTVTTRFLIVKPKHNHDDYPTSLRVGDLDKLLRSTLDGIVQGGLLKDDKFVTTVETSKRWTQPGQQAGCHITIEVLA